MAAESPLLIQSVDRAVRILKTLAENGEAGLSLSQLSQRLELNPSTTRHLAATLIQHNLVEQDSSSKSYRLGIQMIKLGNSALANTSLARIARPFLFEIWDATGQSVALLAFHGLLRSPLTDMRSRQILTANSAPLEISTLHATGSGKLLLAFLPEQELDTYFNQVRLERFNEHTLADRSQLEAELQQIRREGVSFDREEYGSGVACISVPIQDASKRLVGCLDMVFPSYRVDSDQYALMVSTMKAAGADLSAQLVNIGFVVP